MNPQIGYDLESKTLMDMLAKGLWLPTEVPAIEHKIKDTVARVKAGLSNPTAAYWTAQVHRLDERLRLRWDIPEPIPHPIKGPIESQGWVIERWVPEWEAWAICGVLGQRHVPTNLLEILKKGDMQRYGTPEEYLKVKREAADAIRVANEKRGTDTVLAAVDKLSDKRIKEFIAVERAVQTGETIVAHGATEKSLDTMRQASFRAQALEGSDLHDESQSLNPGAHPLRQKRAKGGKHVRSKS